MGETTGAVAVTGTSRSRTGETGETAEPSPPVAGRGRAGRTAGFRHRRLVVGIVGAVACLVGAVVVAVRSDAAPPWSQTVSTHGQGAPAESQQDLATAVMGFDVASSSDPDVPTSTSIAPGAEGTTRPSQLTPASVGAKPAPAGPLPVPLPLPLPPIAASPPPDPSVALFPVSTPRSQPRGLVDGPDGNLWFTESNTDVVGRITPQGVVTEFHTPSAFSQPDGIVLGRDRNLWFAESSANKVGRITPAGAITEFAIPTANSQPGGKMALGADGAVWFTERNANRIARVTTEGLVSELPLDPASGPDAALPAGIVAGADGSLWFLETNLSRLGRISPTGVVTQVDIGAGSLPLAIGVDRAGTVWYAKLNTSTGDSRIARIDASGHSVDVASGSPYADVTDLVAGPDGAIWFAEQNTDRIGRIGPGGAVVHRSAPSPAFLATGSDGGLWFTSGTGNAVGRLSLSASG